MSVRIPADVDRPDTVLGEFTARQTAILAAGLVAGWALTTWLPLPPILALAVAAPVALAALAVVVARRDGLTGDQLLAAAARYHLRPRRLVAAPDGLPPVPVLARRIRTPKVAPLDLPATGVDDDGVVDLGRDGSALLCAVTPVNFALRTNAEQDQLVAAFARLLHADLGGWQLVISTRPADPTPLADRLDDDAGGLPHPALERAARAHAAHLRTLTAERGLLARQLLLVLHDPNRPDRAAPALLRRGEQAAALLAAAGVGVSALPAAAAASVLHTALSGRSGVPDPRLPDPNPAETTAGAAGHRSSR